VLYDDTNPNSINDAIPTGVPTSGQRNALCWAITTWLDQYAQAKTIKIRQASVLSQAWDAIQTSIVNAYGFLNNVLGFIVPDNLFSCVVDNASALSALANATEMEKVKCKIYNELDGIALLEGSLEGAINAAVGSLTGVAQDIACLLDNDYSLAHALNFFFLYGRALDESLTATCDCGVTYDWCYEWDFTVSNGDFTIYNFYGLASGVWTNGIGWQSQDKSSSGFQYRSLTLKSNVFTAIASNVVEWGWEGDYEFGHFEVGGANPDLTAMVALRNSNNAYLHWDSVTACDHPDYSGSPVEHVYSGLKSQTGTFFYPAWYVSNDNIAPTTLSGTLTIRKMWLKGTGTMPNFTGGSAC
jgi:hypothetical protein